MLIGLLIVCWALPKALVFPFFGAELRRDGFRKYLNIGDKSTLAIV